jgi:predicted Rossmann fold flavoprotein
MKKREADVCVIGGGAAGMLAAGMAAQRGCKVLLFEKNQFTGKKLRITGKGRCNVTNDSSVQDVLDNITANSRFMYSSLNGFSPRDVMAFFESLGVPLKTERGQRVFPQSDRAEDIVNALRGFMQKSGVRVVYEAVTDIKTQDGHVTAVVTKQSEAACGGVILCTGGLSYPLTGSTGDGYEMAKRLGHTVTELKPSLVPLECKQSFCRDLTGLSLKNVTFSVFDGKGKRLYSELGEMMFTHFGVTGPLVLSASAHLRDYSRGYYGLIDMKPALDEKKLDQRILRDFEKYSNKTINNALIELLPRSMIPIVTMLAGIPHDTKVHDITKAQRTSLVNTVKGIRVDITQPRPIDEAIVTSGGVSVREVNPTTMESKKVSGLYFAGEILDVDAYTGGFNLQIAWSTAYAAGKNIVI